MILGIVFLILSAAITVITVYFGNLYEPQWLLAFTPLLWIGFFLGIFLLWAIWAAIMGQIYHASKKNYAPNRYAQWVLAETTFLLLLLFRVRVTFTGKGKIPNPSTKFMLVSNHLSGFDHLILISRFEAHRLVCVSKKANFDYFVEGGWTKRAGYLPIEQGNVEQGAEVIHKAASLIASDTCSVCIAPEGTRNKTFPHPRMLPFKPGAFVMALEGKCPIVVAAIQNTNMIFKRFPWRSTHAYCDIVGVMEYEDFKDLTPAQIAEKAQAMIEERFDQKEARFYHVKGHI